AFSGRALARLDFSGLGFTELDLSGRAFSGRALPKSGLREGVIGFAIQEGGKNLGGWNCASRARSNA
ncbi:MAG TPA: hypothetical protein VHX20_09705, partial [Terracidiphilus sp.]|nr:hypothetical protein [Terracidiphilus sp.]